jgi:hypothetical protein
MGWEWNRQRFIKDEERGSDLILEEEHHGGEESL